MMATGKGLASSVKWYELPPPVPEVEEDEPFAALVQKFTKYEANLLKASSSIN